MKRILVPTDFSESAKAAAEFGAALAVHLDAHLQLIHFYDVPTLYSDAPFTVVKDAVAQVADHVNGRLNRELRRLKKRNPALRADMSAVNGPATSGISSTASALSADLIVMGATGTSKLRRLLIGSTVASVLREAPCAVLTVPEKCRFKKLSRIAFATDLKEDNLRAASAFVPFVKAFDAELIFVFVDGNNLLHSDKTIESVTRKVRSKIRYNRISGYVSANPDVVKGLMQFTRKVKSDMLVVYTHRLQFPETLFHQSVTRLAANQADLPVLSVIATDRPL